MQFLGFHSIDKAYLFLLIYISFPPLRNYYFCRSCNSSIRESVTKEVYLPSFKTQKIHVKFC